MKILIIKLGAAGDVVRTTTLLHLFKNETIDWITSRENSILLTGNKYISRVLILNEFSYQILEEYDLIINLEDNVESAEIISKTKFMDLYGCYLDKNENLSYTENSSAWRYSDAWGIV